MRRSVVLTLVVLTVGVAARGAAAQGADVIRGRVIATADSAPIPNATVTVTSISGGVNRSARTDRNGRFTVIFPNGDGDYMVAFVALGYTPRQYELRRIADEGILVANATLGIVSNPLDAVHVIAPRDKVARNDTTPDIGGADRRVDASVLTADQLGDLPAMVASIPGVAYVPGSNGDPSGFSVLGLTPDQNLTTLNGMATNAADLPRDAQVVTSVSAGQYDVSQGGYSGGNAAFRLRPGTNFIHQVSSLLGAAPPAEFTTTPAQALGREYSLISLGGQSSGPISLDQAFYNVSYSLGQQASPLRSLLNTDSTGLTAAGIAPDSAARLLQLLGANGIPLTVGAVPGQRLTDNGNFQSQFDFAPPSSKSGSAYSLTFDGAWHHFVPLSAPGTSALPAYGGDRTTWNGDLQFHHSTYFGFGILSETGVSVSESRSATTPFLALPSGSVLITSQLPDGTMHPATVAFGGSPSRFNSSSSTRVDATNVLSWFSENNKHRVKLSTELRRDDFAVSPATNTLGTFQFNSLGDLANGTPASFTRTLSPSSVGGGGYIAGLGIGDQYAATSNLHVQYGGRFDANEYIDRPALDPAVGQMFGVANDAAPSHMFMSPRVGFSYTYGSAPQVSGFTGAARVPRAVLQGGIGVFQNYPLATQLSGPMANTGLASALQQVACAGLAAPSPDWGSYETDEGSIPSQCSGAGAGTRFSSGAPNVQLAARDLTAPRSVRSSLQWSGPVLDNRLRVTANGVYSLNLNQPESVDLNFDPTVRFALADEDGRPVYVSPSSIDPASGLIAPGAGRVSQQFNRVTELRSDLTSVSTQFQLLIAPSAFSTKWTWYVSYIWRDFREQTSGFTSTADNPLDRVWARGPGDWRHEIDYLLRYNLFNAVVVTWIGRFNSGTPYTPLVQGDVNGDGYSNDRAFIYDPAHTPDPALAAAMQSLLAGAPSKVRGCLISQLGQLAGLNSCEGPWTTSASLNISFNSLKFHLPQRANFSVSISNPLGAADLMLHGENHLQGWGQTPFVDPNLLYVRGFDPVNQRFIYAVNQRFGSSSVAYNTALAPVAVTALLRWDTGPPRERQSLTQMLDRGRSTEGVRAKEEGLRAMYGTNTVYDPLRGLLAQADSLKLTTRQADSIATLERWYAIRTDSIWGPVAKALGTLPARYDRNAAYERYRVAREKTIDLLLHVAPGVRELLTAEQRRKLPDLVASSLDERYLRSIRSSTAGAGDNPF